MHFYQNGILRVLIDQKDSQRFRISQEDLPVEWDQLIPLSEDVFIASYTTTTDGFSMTGLTREA